MATMILIANGSERAGQIHLGVNTKPVQHFRESACVLYARIVSMMLGWQNEHRLRTTLTAQRQLLSDARDSEYPAVRSELT